jgi:hypothetical protein
MSQIFESRKPGVYIKTHCKDCIVPIEFLPEGCSKGQKVSVKCFACEKVNTYEVTAPAKKTEQDSKSTNASKPKTSRKRGTGIFLVTLLKKGGTFVHYLVS